MHSDQLVLAHHWSCVDLGVYDINEVVKNYH
jgi:hypothetical protein